MQSSTCKKKILVFTNSFPKPHKPQWGIFIAQTLRELQSSYDIIVINPVPWFPKSTKFNRFEKWYEFARVPLTWSLHGMQVYYPRFYVIPKFSQPFLGLSEFLGVYPVFKKIAKNNTFTAVLGFYLFPEGVVSALVGKLIDVPVILSARGSDINIEAKHWIKCIQISWALKEARAVVGVSRDLCAKMIAIGAEESTVHYIPNGVDSQIFRYISRNEAREKLGLLGKKVLLYVGRLDTVKGVNYLLEALSILKKENQLNFSTYFVGDGPERTNIYKHMNRLGLEGDVILVGMRPYSEIPLWLNAADILCLPSINEGNPNVVLEALACGTPVIASSVGGIPELISESNGILFPKKDCESMARNIKLALSREWKRDEIVATTREYSWCRTGKKYKKLIELYTTY